MKSPVTPFARIFGSILIVVCVGGLALWYFLQLQDNKIVLPQADYTVRLDGKQWDTTITGRYTVADIDSFEPLPILIVDLFVSNTTAKPFLLDCVLVRSDDGGKTVQDVYYPFWALNITRQDDLRLVEIPAQGTQTGQIAFELAPTEKALWLHCGGDVRVQVK